MTDTELFNLIDVIQTSKAEFQTVEVKRAEKSAPDKLYDTLSSFQTRTAEALSCSVYMKTRGSK